MYKKDNLVILAGDLRRGTKILYKGEPYTVLEYQHVKPGKGGAYMRTKMKNLISGLVFEETFRSEEKLETPNLEYREMLYVYQQDGLYEFLDQESYDQVTFNKEQLGDVINFLKEQTIYTVLYFDERPIAVNPPLFMDLEVIEAPPGVRGDTAQGGSKPAKLETGLVLQVPLFVDEGDIIKVDTRDAKYIERVDKRR
jgi:elongation factor P